MKNQFELDRFTLVFTELWIHLSYNKYIVHLSYSKYIVHGANVNYNIFVQIDQSK